MFQYSNAQISSHVSPVQHIDVYRLIKQVDSDKEVLVRVGRITWWAEAEPQYQTIGPHRLTIDMMEELSVKMMELDVRRMQEIGVDKSEKCDTIEA